MDKSDSNLTFKLQYLAAQAIMKRAIAIAKASPPPTTGPMEDWERPDPNTSLPMWNLWGDAGLVTRLTIYAPYSRRDVGTSPIHTDTDT